jgi:hypothetical protein
MQCQEFRHRLDVDPYRMGPEAEAHAADCPECAEHWEAQMSREARLAEALRLVAPQGLPQRATSAADRVRRHPGSWGFALAGALLIVLATAHHLPLALGDDPAAAGIAHVLAEPPELWTQGHTDRSALAAELERVGARLTATLPARHAGPCEVPGGGGAHIVLDTPNGTVMLLLMPNLVLSRAQSKQAQGLIALARPAKRGCYALVATNPEALTHAEELLKTRVLWA